jgi:prepilin-type N-terminal cleavage/methylation domain-containing protein
MNWLRQNARGFSLVELISVMAIVVVLAAAAAYGISIFFFKYKELTYYADLQQDLFDTLQQMKNGVPIGTGEGAPLLGVASATSLEFPAGINETGYSTEILCNAPIAMQTWHEADYVRFYWDQNRSRICMRYKYGQDSPSTPVVLFPTNHKSETKVTALQFKFVGHSNNSVVQVTASAQIRVTSSLVRSVSYTTFMRLSWL